MTCVLHEPVNMYNTKFDFVISWVFDWVIAKYSRFGGFNHVWVYMDITQLRLYNMLITRIAFIYAYNIDAYNIDAEHHDWTNNDVLINTTAEIYLLNVSAVICSLYILSNLPTWWTISRIMTNFLTECNQGWV